MRTDGNVESHKRIGSVILTLLLDERKFKKMDKVLSIKSLDYMCCHSLHSYVMYQPLYGVLSRGHPVVFEYNIEMK